MFRFVAAGMLGLALLGGPASAEVAPAPLGLDADGTEFAILSNGNGWKVGPSRPTAPVKVVQSISTADPNARGALQRQPYGYIWAAACTASQQTLTFRRTFWLPGKARTIGARLGDTIGSGSNQAIASAKIYINGKLAFSANKANINLDHAVRPAAKLFKFGNNTIDVVVIKRAEKDSFGKCVNSGKRLGVSFYIYGEYESDLWLSANTFETTHIWVRAQEGATVQPFVYGASPRNDGPSAAYKGVLSVGMSGPIDTVEEVADVSGSGLRNCTVTHSVGTAKMTCEVYRMPAGGSGRATFRALVRLPATFDTVTVTGAASVNSRTDDPNLGTNGWIRWHHICSWNSTNPSCP